MKLYLVQHGEAKPKSEDLERPLTYTGRADVARVAALARRAGVEVHQLRHSDRGRATQTAAILDLSLLTFVMDSNLAKSYTAGKYCTLRLA